MEEKVKGITLRGVNYKESDKILTVFTLEKGKITVSARGVRKGSAKMKGAAEQFCLYDCVLAEKAGRYTLKELDVIDFFYGIRTDIVKYYAGMVALEYTDNFAQENLVASEYFALLTDFLQNLAYGEAEPKNLLLRFLYSALKDAGIAIDFSSCGRCGEEITDKVYLSALDGCSVCANCKMSGEKEYSFKTYSYLKNLCEGGEESYDKESADNGLRFFGYYIAEVASVKLKSLQTLLSLN